MRDRDAMSKAKYLTKDRDASSLAAICRLDDILVQLASSIDVDLMPGPNDPTNQLMPQQPLHHCLFPQTNVYPTFQSVTNPYKYKTSHGIVLGTSGQNVEDVMSNSDLEDPLDVLEQMLRWSHIAPTCPDTLGCFPFSENATDPFILDCLPKVFFVGNQKKYSFRKIETTPKQGEVFTTLLLALPSFSSEKAVIRLNLATLECEEVVFDTAFDSFKQSSEEHSPILNN